MLGSHLGREIDGQECVLRMNHAPTAGFEEDVGTRSTVRVVSHTSVPLLLRNQPYFFQQSRDTIYVIWGPSRKMSREKGGPTYRALLRVLEMYPRLQLYTLTEEKMAYCDDVFQNETGKNRYCGPPACPPWHRFRPSVRVSPSHRCAPQGEIRLLPEHGVVHHDPGHGAVRAHLRLRYGQRQLLQVRGWGWQRGLRGGATLLSPRGAHREKNHSSVPYHYFEKGRLDECRMYLVHERAPRAGHRFITEKAIFSRWAKRKDIIFSHPSWAGG